MKKFLLLILFILTFLPLVSIAQEEYTMLAPIPQLTGGDDKVDLSDFTSNAFKFLLGLVAAGTVLSIVAAGFQYMTTDIVNHKTKARDRITNSLVALLLVISSYTILNTLNPALVNFDIEIPGIVTAPEPPPFTAGSEGDTRNTGVGGCSNCIPVVSTIPQKPPGAGCAGTNPCAADAQLVTRLLGLKEDLAEARISWWVSEMYPPTRDHQNNCHRNGTCVDITFRDRSSGNNFENIKSVIRIADENNLRAQYETTSADLANRIRRETGLSESQVRYIPGITGSHFSVYMK